MRTDSARTDVMVALLGAIAIALWDLSGLDEPLIRLFGSSAGFALRDHWFFSGVLHRGGYWLSVALFATMLLTCFGPWRSRMLSTRERTCWVLGVTLSLLLIPGLKQISLTSCPWSLAEFGGTAQYVSHWSLSITDGGPGKCFPAGHASGAFAFIGGWFAWRAQRPQRARVWLIGVLILGTIFGLAQMVRGAHFLSHTLYTAWLCWVVTALVFHAARRRPAPNPRPPPTRADPLPTL